MSVLGPSKVQTTIAATVVIGLSGAFYRIKTTEDLAMHLYSWFTFWWGNGRLSTATGHHTGGDRRTGELKTKLLHINIKYTERIEENEIKQ